MSYNHNNLNKWKNHNLSIYNNLFQSLSQNKAKNNEKDTFIINQLYQIYFNPIDTLKLQYPLTLIENEENDEINNSSIYGNLNIYNSIPLNDKNMLITSACINHNLYSYSTITLSLYHKYNEQLYIESSIDMINSMTSFLPITNFSFIKLLNNNNTLIKYGIRLSSKFIIFYKY